MMDSTGTGAGTIGLQSFADNTLHAYSETLGLPFQDLAPTYYFPVYENLWAPLSSQVLFGVP